ncbi:MAG: sugar ABC transporter permease, partial [Erysipelotrichaceae bacterium]|nr:sugar ABC transporter permease [Erysipelotrichaceae bacterium]
MSENKTHSSEFDDILKQQKKLQRKEQLKNDLPLYLMMLPGMIYLICNNYLPMFGILLAFKRINYAMGILKSPWVGLANFEYLFKTKDAFTMIRNTIAYNAVWILMDLAIAVFIALCMNEIAQRKIAKVIQPIICFPSMVSAVILSFLVYAFLSQSYGYLN